MGGKNSVCLICSAALEFSGPDLMASATDPADKELHAPVCIGCCLDRLVRSRGGLAFRYEPSASGRDLVDPGRVVVTASAVEAIMASGHSIHELLKRHANLLGNARLVTAVKVGGAELWLISDLPAQTDGEAGTTVMRAGESRLRPGILPLTA